MQVEEGLEPVVFDLGAYAAGTRGLSAAVCHQQAEAAAFCLQLMHHRPGIELEGDWAPAAVLWPALPANASTSYEETQATALGAEAIAIIGAGLRCGLEVASRSRIGTGFDFYMQPTGDDADEVFAEARAMEVSGTRQLDAAELRRRVKVKREQVQKGGRGIPALVVIVGFAQPTVVIEEVP